MAVADVREPEGNETVSLIEQAGGEGLFVKADVSQERDVQAMVDAAVDTYGRLDCAFNNAGLLTRHEQGWTDTPGRVLRRNDRHQPARRLALHEV